MALGRPGKSAFLLLAALLLPGVRYAHAQEHWVEVHSPNFTVVSDAGESEAMQVVAQFEQFRSVIRTALPQLRLDPDKPVTILVVKDAETLQGLLPGFRGPERVRPSGIFVAGEQKYYAAVQLAGTGYDPRHNLYHEYVHLLNRLNFPRLPTWLNEGLAEVYANTEVRGEVAEIGRPDPNHLHRLAESFPLDLDRLFAVDHTSPEYNEANRASAFYAESWLLTHYLLFADQGAHRKQFNELLDRLAHGDDPFQAAHQVLNEIPDLLADLRNYVQRTPFPSLLLPTRPVAMDQEFTSHMLTEAEAKAVQGDFLLQTQRPVEARAMLTESLRLDSHLTTAQESMGRLALLEGNRKEALDWFTRAVEGGSESYLAHYYYALLTAEEATDPDAVEEAEDHLEQTIELNPSFAPAYAALSGFYAVRPGMIHGALELAQKAVELDPARLSYQLNLGSILLRMRRTGEAVALGEQLAERPLTEKERGEVAQFLDAARKYDKELEEWQQAYAAARAEAEERRRKREEAEKAANEAAELSAKEPPAPKWGAGPKRRVFGSGVEGWISSITCRGKTLDMDVSVAAYQLKLHSGNYFDIGFNTSGWTPPDNFDPCVHLKGKLAVIIYTAVRGKPYAGEILSIEVRQ